MPDNRKRVNKPQSPPRIGSTSIPNDARWRQYLSAARVCARYDITDMSLWRWLKDQELKFPKPALRVKDRRYWLEADLIAWEASCVPRGNTPNVKCKDVPAHGGGDA
jgi:predicted DNA-binding transcriptional regulator AlpA